MKSPFPKNFPRILSGAIAALLCGLPTGSAQAGTFTWGNVTGNFTDPTKWVGGVAPSGLDPTDILIFGGAVGTTGAPTNYTATSNSSTNPFIINQLNFQGTTTTPGSGPIDTIAGTTPIDFAGTAPAITQSGTAALDINAPIVLGANLTLGGNITGDDAAHDVSNITLNGALSGNFDISKNGTSTFRFGSLTNTSPSTNTWFGTLTINNGTIRFNNNAYTASTALRSNPVVLTSATSVLSTEFKPLGTGTNQDPDSSLRLGTLSGSAGTVQAQRDTTTSGVFSSADIVITALNSGSFGGTVRNVQTGSGDTSGALVVRGIGTQTFTGTLNLASNLETGDLATAVLAGNATMGAQTTGSVVLGDGTVRLDNSVTNNSNRLPDLNSTTTGVETVGGGTLSIIGNSAGTLENAGSLQLGSSGKSRSGALTINVVSNSTTAATGFNFQAYTRDAAGSPYDTVDFTANNGSGAVLALGAAATGPRVTFTTVTGTAFTVPLFNGLLGNTGTADATSVGWATVNGSDFATYGANGITAVTTTAAPDPSTTGSKSANVAITTNFTITSASGYSLNSLKLAPTAAGQVLDLATAGTLSTSAILLAGTTDFTISASGGGKIGNSGASSPRYFDIASATLTVSASLFGAQAPIVKSGGGTLVLTNSANVSVTQPVVIDDGYLRATPGSSLPAGEIRFRGGVLEITGGGTFSRQLGLGSGKITWSGIDSLGASIGTEQGSGGFAAIGANAIVNLTPASGTTFNWEDPGFVNSGHALMFGSIHADSKLTFVNNFALNSVNQVVNYNARQIQVIDNPNSTTDVAVLSGTISGTVQNDLLKTGNGELILTGTDTYAGATLIAGGTLRVNGSTSNSYLTDVRDSGTLGGGGTVGAVQVEGNGTLAPGDLTGHTSVLNTSNLKFTSATSKLSIEIGGNTAGGNNATGYDRVNVVGGVTLSGAQLSGSLLNGFTPASTDLFFVIINDGSDPVQGTFAQGNSVTIGSQVFNISYSGNFTGNAATNSFTGGNDVVLQLAVPEPGTASLLLLGALGLGMRRRRS